MHFTNTIYLFLRFFIGFSQRSYLSSIGNCSDLTRRCIKWEITLNHFNLSKKSDMKKKKESYVTLWKSLKKLLKRQFYHIVLRPLQTLLLPHPPSSLRMGCTLTAKGQNPYLRLWRRTISELIARAATTLLVPSLLSIVSRYDSWYGGGGLTCQHELSHKFHEKLLTKALSFFFSIMKM